MKLGTYLSGCAKITVSLAALALLCSCHKEEEKAPAAPTATGAKPAIVSAEKTSFEEVTSKLDPGGNLYVYLSTEQALSGLSEKINSLSNFLGSIPTMTSEQNETIDKVIGFTQNFLKESGIEQISGVGMSSIAREPGFYYSKLIVHHYPGHNQGAIWSVMGKAPHPLDDLDLLPEDTVLATFSDVDVPLIWNSIENHFEELNLASVTDGLHKVHEQFQEKTGLDLNKTLASLGGDYGVILTLDKEKKITLPLPSGTMEIPSPGLAIVIKVNSDVIFNRVDELIKGNPLVVKTDGANIKMRTFTIPLPLPVELRPSIARSGDYMILATSDTMIRELLDVKAGKRKGFKSTPEFARLSQGIPDAGNNFSLVGAQFAKTITELQQQTLTNQGKMSATQAEAMQHLFSNATNGSSYSVGVNGSDGWEAYANGSQSIQSAILPMVAAAGVAAAVAVPAIIKAHQASQKSASAAPAPDNETVKYNHIIRNLRQLQTAEQKWAKEKGKATGDAATLGDLVPYLQNGPIKPEDGEEYTVNPVGTAPTAKLAHDLHGHSAGEEISAPARKNRAAAAAS